MSEFNKTVIMPKVVLYRDVFPDVSELMEIVKESEALGTGNALIKEWGKWSHLGTMSFANGEPYNLDVDKELIKRQRRFINMVYNAYRSVLKDYIKDWSNEGEWKSYIKDWNFDEFGGSLNVSGISILKYNPTEKTKYAMDYHTDEHEYESENRGTKFVITFTLYLNDDYDGGEISFLNEDNGESITYKQKAGDITVFPSGRPYWHGVMPVKNGNKYLIRMFILTEYEGSEEWLAKEEQYGKDIWAKMEEMRIHEDFHSGKFHRYVLEKGEDTISDQTSIPFYVEKITYIDGRLT